MERRKELDILTSKKYSFNEKKLLFIGIVSGTIYDKALFSNNELLKEYTTLYEQSLHLEEPYKEYLYKSRTLLASRICRDLLNSEDNNELLKSIDRHVEFIKDNNEKAINKNRKKKKDSNLLDDMLSRGKSD